MQIVSDANIFIDFEVAGLIAQLFRLPHEIAVLMFSSSRSWPPAISIFRFSACKYGV